MPNPSQQSQAVTCSGAQSGGYVLTTEQSPLTVNAGASIQNAGDALTVSIPASSTSDYRTAAITVNGTITSSSGNGILVSSGASYPGNYDFTGTSATITVAAGAAVSGVNGIALAAYPGFPATFAPVNVSLDNAGSIAGTGGAALVSSGSNIRFTAITNESGAALGAVAASFYTLTNNGTIDGGQASAINNVPFYFEQAITNTGAIRSEGSSTTILLGNSYGFTNSGTITNTGGGIAISSSGAVNNAAGGVISANGSDVLTGTYLSVSNNGTIINTGAGDALSGMGLTVTNAAGATITAGSGGIAVNASGSLQLTNSGTINGDVIAGFGGNYNSTLVDSTQGTINGNVTFGATFNTLVGSISGGSVQTGVNGTITGATGTGVTNTLELTTAASATLTGAVSLPANFNQVEFAPASGTTLTLGSGFSSPAAIVYTGQGALVNATTLSGNGQIVNGSGVAGTFTNSGTITSSNLGGPVALAFSSYASLNNTGTITATGDAVNGGYSFTNSGTISAGGTAVQDFAVGGFTNSGTISSSAGTALSLSQSCTCSLASNSGTISGAVTGVQLSDGGLNNSGAITGGGYGIMLGYYGTVNNLPGGVITGGTAAIGDPNATPFGLAVANQGTINGDVNLASNGQSYFYPGNRFDAAPGGVLNGNLALGSGGTLITDLVNTGTGQFAGISGVVTASNANLVYNVSASATIAPTPAGFSSVAYQLFGNPVLTMAAGTSANATLVLAGTGSVNLAGTIATTNANAVNAQAALVAASGYTTTGPSLLALTNQGTITTTVTAQGTGINAAVLLGSNSLTNSGTITFADNSASPNLYSNEAAVLNGTTITNSGTITGVNAGAVTLGYNAYQLSNAPVLTNSGTLTSNAVTIQIAGAGTINNSGAIISNGQAAIGLDAYFITPILVNNEAGGTITGSGDAIELTGGTIRNAGTINGNVNLNYSSYSFFPGTYYDNGGTLNGNLTLSANGALVIDLANQGTGPLGGVTGTINANGSLLIYQVNASATIAGPPPLGAGFSATGFALANNSALTLASGSQQTTTVNLAGTGSVILDGTITTADTQALVTQPLAILNATGNASTANALTLTNNGTISVTADGNWLAPVAVSLASSDTLINNGTITISDSVVPAGYYPSGAVIGGLSVTNSGTIAATNVSAIVPGTSLTNSGRITSNGVAVSLSGIAAITNSTTNITNSGTITSTGTTAISGISPYPYNNLSATITNLAGGVITGATDAIDMDGGTIVNAGTINGNVNLASAYFFPFAGGYYANGGTLNGNLTLGAGQALLVNYGATGPLGGVTGSINAQGAALLYNLGSNITVTALPAASGFALAGYQLANNATLTIPASAALTGTLLLAGTGSVVLNGTITTTDQNAVQSIAPVVPLNAATSSALAITNNGSIVTTSASPALAGGNAVSLGSLDTLANNGSITLTNTSGFPVLYAAAVGGGGSITNAGTISGSGVSAIITSTPYSYVNNLNVSGTETLTNSGTITSDQYAVLIGGTTALTNSGTITSTGLAAISNGPYYQSATGFAVNIILPAARSPGLAMPSTLPAARWPMPARSMATSMSPIRPSAMPISRREPI